MGDDFPENVEIDVVVAVYEPVAQGDNLHPRNAGVLGALSGRDTARRFADDLQQPHQRKVERTVGVQICASFALRHLRRFARGVEHVP